LKVIVPDASVLLKWVLPAAGEHDAEAALQLRDLATQGKIILKAPSLWVYEVGNTLTRRFPGHAQPLLDALIEFNLAEGERTSRWFEQVIELTRKYRVTFYDAAYHALALVEGGIFVTADRAYLHRAQKAGAVVALQEWGR